MTRKGNRTSENTQLFLLFPQYGRYQQSSTGLMSDHFYSSPPTTTRERSHRRPHWPQNKRNLRDGRNHPNYPTPNQFRHLLKIIQAARLVSSRFPLVSCPQGLLRGTHVSCSSAGFCTGRPQAHLPAAPREPISFCPHWGVPLQGKARRKRNCVKTASA